MPNEQEKRTREAAELEQRRLAEVERSIQEVCRCDEAERTRLQQERVDSAIKEAAVQAYQRHINEQQQNKK